jgi:hypothetical protein
MNSGCLKTIGGILKTIRLIFEEKIKRTGIEGKEGRVKHCFLLPYLPWRPAFWEREPLPGPRPG